VCLCVCTYLSLCLYVCYLCVCLSLSLSLSVADCGWAGVGAQINSGGWNGAGDYFKGLSAMMGVPIAGRYQLEEED
jgi:hypothetical protein